MPSIKSLSGHQAGNLVPVIEIEIFPLDVGPKFTPLKMKALIDTGAYNSIVHKDILDDLKIPPEDKATKVALLHSRPIKTTKQNKEINNIAFVNKLKQTKDFLFRKEEKKDSDTKNGDFDDGVLMYQVGMKLENNSLFEPIVLGLYFEYYSEIKAIIGWDILSKLGFCVYGPTELFCYCNNIKCGHPPHINDYLNKKGV